MNPELTIVIPCLNNLGIHDLIRDFYRLHDPSMFRIIVIDQTKDGLVFDEKTPVHLHLKTYKSLGWSKAVNLGWQIAGTPYTLLANDDVRLLDARWYEDAKAHLKEDVLAVNPFPALRTWDGGGDPQWYWDIHAEKFAWTKDKKIESYEGEGYEHLQKDLSGGCSNGTTYFFTLFKTETREIVGLIDEAFPINGSDYDHNRRIFLTCSHCNKRKHEHSGEQFRCSYESATYFKSYKVLTCTHSLVHHECGVTKSNLTANKELDGYELVAKSRNIFNQKWATEEDTNPDIYGRNGRIEPATHWCEMKSL